MGQFSDPVATHPRTNKVEVLPPPGFYLEMPSTCHFSGNLVWCNRELRIFINKLKRIIIKHLEAKKTPENRDDFPAEKLPRVQSEILPPFSIAKDSDFYFVSGTRLQTEISCF